MHNETVYCKECRKKIAWWDMFTNIQYEEEWECTGQFWQSVDDTWKSKDGKNSIVSNNPDRRKYPIKVKREKNFCALIRGTQFCRKCAYKLHFKCSAPRCKGIIRKRKDENGKGTKYDHGGW